jgi:Protein of unknown function (DUF3617)
LVIRFFFIHVGEEFFMRHITVFLLLAFMAAPVYAGDLWEIVSTVVGPDGSPVSDTQTKCLPKDSVDASKMLDQLGGCTFDQRSGNASAMTFAMTCRIQGMPANLGSFKVAGDAKLNGDKFDMRYTITLGGDPSLGGADFKMAGTMNAHNVGQCSER